MSSSGLSVERGWRFSPEKDVSGAMSGDRPLGGGDFVATLSATIANLKFAATSGGCVPRYV